MNLTTGFDSRLTQTAIGLLAALAVITFAPRSFGANTNLHTTWLWHMHQPIYWPDRAPANHSDDHYQNAWDTIQLNNEGLSDHPTDTSLPSVFGDNNRIADYQNYPHDAVQGIMGMLNAGGQLNYSGALMENIQSLAAAGQYYGSNWDTYNQAAHAWTTSSGKTRLDLTNFTYHHCIAALVSEETLTMDILIHQRQQQIFWGSGATNQVSRGYFPAETCFSERIIPTLNKLGISWSVVANNHLTRSCSDFVVPGLGSGGEACDLPNKADQINPAQGAGSYITRGYTSLGCSPTATAPFAFQPHYARYVDPATGVASTLIVVPADQLLSWADSFNPWADSGSGSLLTPITALNNPSKPELLLLAHDGDNAWADGNSYWASWADQFANDMNSQGNEPTTIEQYLSDYPVSTSDVVHVEDGGWVFDQGGSDFGSPLFVGWDWPPSYTTNTNPHNVVDPSLGVSSDADVWRTYIATENRVKTAQQITNSLALGLYTNRIDQIRDPGSFGQMANPVELGWHYYLGGLDSGFVYYGCSADECWRPVIAQSNAVRNVDPVIIGNESLDTTPPTVLNPQRSPWNPGTTNFGVEYSSAIYVPSNSDFWVWTYAYDVSGITNVTLLFRSNGIGNPPTKDEFKTYAGGPDTAPWVQQTMIDRAPAPQSSLLPPKYMADYYYTRVRGLSATYVDYYVSATDSRGNTYNSPIQHVYVAVNAGGPPPPPTLSVSPGTLTPSVVQGQNAQTQSVTVANLGTGSFNFTIATNQPWISASPTSGTVSNNSDTILLAYNTAGLTTGTYSAALTVSSTNAASSPQSVTVTLTVNPVGGGGFTSPFTSMTVAGTFEGWNPAANNMDLIASDVWQYETTLSSVTNFQFKFAANGAWTTNWGGTTATHAIPFSSAAVLSATTNILVNGTFNGLYQFTFNDLTAAYTVTNLLASPYATMSVAGTFDGWNPAANNMELVANNTWQFTTNFTSVANAQFKFAANGAWTSNWGNTNLTASTVPFSGTGIASSSTNILVGSVLNGQYLFTFNDQTLAYSLESVSADTVGDGIPDEWRAQYFSNVSTNGTATNGQSCATCDADGTGQDNLFKYVAGLDPTNPASVFVLMISTPTNPATQNLIFGPIAGGRVYVPLVNAGQMTGTWSTLAGYTGPATNGNQVAITDTNATETNEFYRINITLP